MASGVSGNARTPLPWRTETSRMSVIVSPSERGKEREWGPETTPCLAPFPCSGPWLGEDAQAYGRGGDVIPEARVEAAWSGRADWPSLLALQSVGNGIRTGRGSATTTPTPTWLRRRGKRTLNAMPCPSTGKTTINVSKQAGCGVVRGPGGGGCGAREGGGTLDISGKSPAQWSPPPTNHGDAGSGVAMATNHLSLAPGRA